jgi:hypothetical protein
MIKNSKFLLIILFAFCFLFIYCSREHFSHISLSIKTNVSLLPQDALGIGYANLTSIKKSPFFEELFKSWEKDSFYSEELEQIFNETGFDIRNDVEEVFFSISKKNIGSKRTTKGILIATGNFNRNKIVDYLENHKNQGIESVSYKEFYLFRLVEENMVFCFPNSNKIIAGQEDAVKISLDNIEKSTKISPEVLLKIKDLKYKQAAWLIIDAQPVIKELSTEYHNDVDLGQIRGLKSIENMNFSANIENKIYFNGKGNFLNKEDTQLFFDTFKGLIAAAKLSLNKDRRTVDVLNKIKVKNKGNKIELDFTFTKDDIEKLKENKEKLTFI